MNRRNVIGAIAVVFSCALFGSSGIAFGNAVCADYHVVALPDYQGAGGNPGALMGGYPRVLGYDVVWTGWTGPPPPGVGGKLEIFRFDGATVSQVTSNINALGNWVPFISSLGRIVYIGDTGTTNDLFMYDIGTSTATRLTYSTGRWPMVVTDFSDHSVSPRITVEVMDQWLGSPWPPTWITVDLWDGRQIITLSPRLFNHGSQVSPYRAVWHASNMLGGGYDIFLYEMASKITTQMTMASSGWTWRDPQLSDPYIVWWGTDYWSQTQITLCNLNQGISYRHTVASCPSYKQPKLANSAEHVVWSWVNDSDLFDEVWHHVHQPPFPMTRKIYPGPKDMQGAVDCIDTSYPYAAFVVRAGGPYEIYVYDIVNLGTPQRIATGISSSPVWLRLSTELIPPYGYIPVVVWEENLGDINPQAYMAIHPYAVNTIYVDDDSSPPGNGSASDPYTTIASAVNQAKIYSNIDIIEVRPGTYNENIDMTGINHPVTLRSQTWNDGYSAILPHDTVIQGVETPARDPVVKLSEGAKLLGFKIIASPSAAKVVVLDSLSTAEVAYNRIIAEADATAMPLKILTALEVEDPLETMAQDDILVHNNVVIVDAQGNQCDARGISVIQDLSDTSLIRDEKLHIINNTIDVTSQGFAKALYVEANTNYETTDTELLTLGVVVRNNILVIESEQADGAEGLSACAFKPSRPMPPHPMRGQKLPIRYNYLYIRDNDSITPPINGFNCNIYIHAYEKANPVLPGSSGNIILHPLTGDTDRWRENPPKYSDAFLHLEGESPCVDKGSPEDGYSNEPLPNGERINIGAYGNTLEAAGKILWRAYAVRRTRVGRTEFEYLLGLSITNTSDVEISAGHAELIDASPQVGVSDNVVSFPAVGAGSAIDSNDFGDYFKIEVNRSQVLTPALLIVSIEFSRVLNSKVETSSTILAGITNYGSTSLTGNRIIGFKPLEELSVNWLWVGPEGSVAEDVYRDGTVNLRDFARLADNWLGTR